MASVFEFNIETADFLTPEQKKYFLAPFLATWDEYQYMMQQAFPKAYRRAGRIAVREMTIVVIKDMQDELRNFPALIAMPSDQDPSTWGFAFRYRADVPWYVACLSGRFDQPTFGSYPVVQLMHTRDLINWPPLDVFISQGLWSVQQNKTPNWNPLDNFLYCISPYIRPSIVNEIATSLRNVNFFPLETDNQTSYRLEQDRSDNAWEEIQGIARSFFYPMVDPGLHEFWQKVKNHPRTQIWVARSYLYPEADEVGPREKLNPHCKFARKPEPTMLGFLIGGLHPINEEPQLYGVCVLPDERRRGIATSLIRRFFSQTGYVNVCAGVYMGPHIFQYEGAGLLKSLGATVRTKGKFVWHWTVPSPLQINRDCNGPEK